ncbi:hypothetical protein [Verrucosispora sioxanthis]|uniref:hypothetical protein n=1 Tax=Verrucosispora sioxanthis TaxID=2499994 RepID=UPI001C1118D6|nr:hypothetical protein [Verrucosispora sioxanthis]
MLALVSATALASFALVVGTTVARGLTDGALDVDADADAATPALAERIAAAPGVEQVVVAQVTDSARVFTESALLTPRLVVVDAVAFQRLLATTPLPDAPALARLAAPGPDPLDVPALVRSSSGDLRIGLAAVGTAPAVGAPPTSSSWRPRLSPTRGCPPFPTPSGRPAPARRGPCRTAASPPTWCYARTSCGHSGWLR